MPSRNERKLLAVEHQRRVPAAVRVGLEREHRANPRGGGIQRHVEIHGFDEPIGRTIVFEANGFGGLGAHGILRASGNGKEM